MASRQGRSGSWGEARIGGDTGRRGRKGQRVDRLAGVACVLLLGLLSAPSASADVMSWQAAVRGGAAVDDAPNAPTAQVELESVAPNLESPTNPTARQYRIDDSDRPVLSPELRTRVWWGTAMAGLGTGADLVPTGTVPGWRPVRPVMGVRASMTERTRLVYEVRGPAVSSSSAASSLLPGVADNETRLSLEFRSAPSAAQHLRNGLFRVQLSNSSALLLKPRSGGVLVSYRAQF